jgi:glutathione S-transferase
VKLYSSPTSPFARKVRIALREKGVACDEIDTWSLGAASGLVDHNPLGKVPSLVLDDGTDLFDSVVIVEYIDAIWPSPRLIPETLPARTLVRRWEALSDGIADAAVLAMLEGRRAEALQDPAALKRQHGKILSALVRADHDLGERTWCVGDDFTLADAALASALGYLDLRCPTLWRGKHPRLETYLARLEQRPSVASTKPPAA